MKSKHGELSLNIPCDRNGEFAPGLIKKGQTDIIGLEDKVIAMYACGMSTRDISSHVEEIYGYKLTAENVSVITDKVHERRIHWQNRPLEAIYAIVFLDCLFVKIRSDSGVIKNMPVYNIVGINLEGKKDCLGIWISTDGESSKYWPGVLTEIQNRGVKDVLIFSVDNLKGISEAINAIFPDAEIQKCIVHQIRNSTKYSTYKDRKEITTDLKKIYQASTEELGLMGLDELETKWGNKYPHMITSRRNNWTKLATCFKYPHPMRKIIYTTNPIESVNRGIRKLLKTKGARPYLVLSLFFSLFSSFSLSVLFKKWADAKP